MGLDWCVNDKIPDESKLRLEFIDKQIEKFSLKLEESWQDYVKRNDVASINLGVFPNDDYTKFQETAEYEKITEEVNHWSEQRSSLVISPKQTLSLPRVGEDKEADDWAIAKYKELSSGDCDHAEKFTKKFPCLRTWMEETNGMFVDELVSKEYRDGLGAITGFFTGAESFRGKCLNFVPWLENSDIHWYESKDPEELVQMGEDLRHVLDEHVASSEQEGGWGSAISEDEQEHRHVVESAAKWCIFWGSRGHGMYAWY